jgi:hypothetical protein
MIFFPDVDGGSTILTHHPKKAARLNKMHMSPMYCTFIRVGTISEGIQNTEIF